MCQQEAFAVLAFLLTTTPEADTAYGARHGGSRRAVVYTELLISAGTPCNEKTGRIGFTFPASR